MVKRKFRFRVWDIDNKCWYRSTQLVIRPYSGTITDGATTPNIVLSQCIGIKDINNILIYEGDIVRLKYVYEHIGEVIFNEKTCGFEIWYNLVVGTYGEKATHKINFANITNGDSKVEVIGNVFENPELNS